MAVDVNDMTGFISHCVNADFLRALRKHVDDRLAELAKNPPPGAAARDERNDGPARVPRHRRPAPGPREVAAEG